MSECIDGQHSWTAYSPADGTTLTKPFCIDCGTEAFDWLELIDENFLSVGQTAQWLGLSESHLIECGEIGPKYWGLPTGRIYDWPEIDEWCGMNFLAKDFERCAKLMGFANLDACLKETDLPDLREDFDNG
jgi:hypothetical protein